MATFDSGTTQAQFTAWKKDPNTYAGLGTGTPYTFEAILRRGETSGNVTTATLYNATTGNPVAASEVSWNSTSRALVTADFADDAANFTDNDLFDVRVKTAFNSSQTFKAGLWIRLTNLSKGEVYYRLHKRHTGIASDTVVGHGRQFIDLSLFNSANVNAYLETTGYGASSPDYSIRIADHGTNDSGTGSSTPVTGCQINASDLGTSRTWFRSPACGSITNGNRFIFNFDHVTGTANLGPQFIVVKFSD